MPDLADEPSLSVAQGSFEKINLIFFFFPCLQRVRNSKFETAGRQSRGAPTTHHQNSTHRTAHTAISGEGDGGDSTRLPCCPGARSGREQSRERAHGRRTAPHRCEWPGWLGHGRAHAVEVSVA